MIRVYLSSSFRDLRELRAELIGLINKQKEQIFLVNMEDYSPERTYPADKCVADVVSCDIYIGVFAWRYGSIEPKSGKSITELELQAAQENGLEILGFVLDENAPWPLKEVDSDRAKINQLRQHVLDNHLGKLFACREDLCQLVLSGLNYTVIRRLQTPAQTLEAKHQDTIDIEKSYLRWLISCHERLEFRGIRHARGGAVSVELRQVYLALQADCSNPLERAAARQSLLSELVAAIESGELGSDSQETAEWYFIAGNPIMPSIESRDRLVSLDPSQKELLNLAEAYFRESQLVVLGDPGSGKTTLARWLSLVLANARLSKRSTVEVPLYQVDPNEDDESKAVSLGLTRLPILVRIAEFAEERLRHNREGTVPPTLLEFFGRNSWLGSYPIWGEDHANCGEKIPPLMLNRLFQQALKANDALIVLDGLDEVPASALRDEIVEEVDAFAQQWIRNRQTIEVSQANPKVVAVTIANATADRPGNRMIVTSRIAGYHAASLQGDLAHVTVEPMSPAAVGRFIQNWMRAVHQEIARPNAELSEIRETADRESAQFLSVLKQPRQRGGRELATNPLLCGILATVFRQRLGELPQERVELYSQAVEMLFDIWLRRERDDEEAQLLKHELFDILEPIAQHIHLHEPTGLIAENQLKQLATEFLAASRGENHLKPTPKLRKAVDDMIRVVREDVGLLAARGEGVWGFLHLTFQEYLAARSLVRDSTTAATRITEHLGDARWREPIRLALGYLNITHTLEFGRVTRQFLGHQTDLEDLLPQSTLMVVGALPDIRQLERPLVELLTDHLIRSYSIRSLFTRLPRRRELIEWACQQLLHNHTKNDFEDRLVCLLETSDTAEAKWAPGIATLLVRLRHFNPRLFQALTKALPHDTDEWSWPIHEALRFAVTPQRESGEALCQPSMGLLQLREELCGRPDLLVVVKKDLDWLRVMFALFGGTGEYFATNVIAFYHRIACFLQQEDMARERYRGVFSNKWGGSDGNFVYNMAVHLDSVGGKELSWVKKLPEFNPKCCHHDSDWNRELLALMQKNASPRELVPQLRQFVSTQKNSHKAREAFLLLWVLDETWQNETCGPVLERMLEDFRRLQSEMSDAATRIGCGVKGVTAPPSGQTAESTTNRVANNLGNALSALRGRLSPTSWWSLAEASMTTCLRNGSEPISLADLRGQVDEQVEPYLLAEMMIISGKGWGDDAVYNSAVFADSVKCSSREFLVANTVLPLACNQLWQVSHFAWPLASIPPAKIPHDDIPPSILTNIQMISPDLGFLKSWAIGEVLRPLIAENTDLLPEILACAHGDFGQRSSREYVFREFNPHLLTNEHPTNEIRGLIDNVTDPYHRARALLRLSRHWPERQQQLVREARKWVFQVKDPLQFEQSGEMLLSVLPSEETTELWTRICSVVLDISDTDEQARAWGRLGLLASPEKAEEFFKLAIQTATLIPDEFARSTTLRLIRRACGDSPQLNGVFAQALEMFVDPILEARTSERWGDVLNLLLPDLQTQKEHLDIWAVLSLLSKAEQAAPSNEHTANELFARLHDSCTSEACAAILERANQGPLELTPLVAQSLESLLANGQVEIVKKLFPRFVATSPEVTPFLQRQMRSSYSNIESIAGLLMAELQGLSTQSISGVLECLQSDSDICVNRACDQLFGMSNKEPYFPASILRIELLEEVFTAKYRSNVAIGVGNAVTWFCERLWFDDASMIEHWAKCLNESTAHNAARFGLSHISHLNDSVLQALLLQFQAGHLAVRNAILISFANLAKHDRLPPDYWEEVRNSISLEECNTLAERNVLACELEDLAQVIADVNSHAEPFEETLSLVDKANKLLNQKCSHSWGDLLQVGDVAESLKKLKQIGETAYSSKSNEFDRWAYAAAVARDGVAQRGFLELLTEWTRVSLSESKEELGEVSYLPSYLVELLAGAASVAPSSFLRCHRKDQLQALLVRTVLEHRSYIGRADAVRLLGYQRHLTKEMLPALRAALRDVEFVRESAIEAMGLFRRMEPNVLEELRIWLSDPSGILAYGAASLLTAIGRQAQTTGRLHRSPIDIRKQIVGMLANAVRDPSSARPLDFGGRSFPVPEIPRICDFFFDCLLKVAGYDERVKT